jgi:pre-mRNA cleavage complex 2 protein Pcf11
MFRSDDYQQNVAPQIFNTVLQRTEDRGTSGGMSEIAKEYDAAVADLTFNSHPIINTLTMIAKENIKNASDIVTVIENRIKNNPLETKLPVVYLMDSIMKNVRGVYINLFAKNLFNTFTGVFARADAQMQRALLHLLQTWRDSKLFTSQVLQKIDIRVQAIQQKNTTPAPVTGKSGGGHANPPPYNKGPGRPAAPAPIPSNVNKPMDVSSPSWLGATPNTQVASAALTQPNLALGLQGLLGQQSSVIPTVNDLNNLELVLLLQVYQMMCQTNNTLKPVAEVTATLPHGTPETQRQHVVTTLQTIVAQQLQINPAQSPVILQTLQQLQQLYDLRATLQTASTIPGVVPPAPTSQPIPTLDPAALALLSGVFTSTGANTMPMPMQPASRPVQPVAPTRQPASSAAHDRMSYGGRSGSKGNDHSYAPARKVSEHDKPSFKNPESLRRRHEWIINAIYYDIPLQCSQCGLRFKEQKEMDSHLDWHFRKNRREKQKSKKPISRAWFQPVNAWIDAKEAEAPTQTSKLMFSG